jgi:hypothetical protein
MMRIINTKGGRVSGTGYSSAVLVESLSGCILFLHGTSISTARGYSLEQAKRDAMFNFIAVIKNILNNYKDVPVAIAMTDVTYRAPYSTTNRTLRIGPLYELIFKGLPFVNVTKHTYNINSGNKIFGISMSYKQLLTYVEKEYGITV